MTIRLHNLRTLAFALGLGLALVAVLLIAVVNASQAAPTLRPAAESLAPTGKSTIGDYVWYDQNVDGEYVGQPGEDQYTGGINGVRLNLYEDANNNGQIDAGEFITFALTGDNPATPLVETGYYTFEATGGITYFVEIDPANFLPSGVLNGYVETNGISGIYQTSPAFVQVPDPIGDVLNIDFGLAKSGLAIEKQLFNPLTGPVAISETIRYRILITNTGDVTMTTVPLYDYYSPACLGYRGAIPSPNSVNAQTGVLQWVNLGTLNPGQVHTVFVDFHAQTTREMYWKEGGWVDYAPNGMPDFSQRQDQWDNPPGSLQKWYACGPVAAANSLWWFDSKFEPNPVPPPTINNGYNLVTAYGPWDDHDARNVQPLVNNLAALMGTNPATGTSVHTLATGVAQYITNTVGPGLYTVTKQKSPTFDWVVEEVRRSEDVVLLLGFWQALPTFPPSYVRVGGHYVTVAGANSITPTIGLSDPYLNRAEQGGSGRVLPAPHVALHVPLTDTVHNDAKYVSHDAYAADLTPVTPAGVWEITGYASTCADVNNFLGQNIGDFSNFPSCQAGSPIITEVEYAVAVSPTTPTNICEPTNNIAVVSNAQDVLGNTFEDESAVPVDIQPATAAIGDYVWYDSNNDGVQNVDEPGIGNVDLNLYLDSNNNGTPEPGELVGTTSTGADGGYIFTNLPAGNYIVDVVNATVPTGYVLTVGPQSETDPTPVIPLTAGEFYQDADFGYYQPPTQPNGAMIGDSVWYDYDADGVRDPGEPGIPGVTVTVTDSNNITYTDITDQNGNYLISVPTGPTLSYTVQPTAGLPIGFTATTPVPQSVPPLQPGDQYLDADFGYDSNTLLGTIGNQVWEDTTPDGIFGAGEVGIPGVSVDLWRNPDGSATLNGDEYIIATTTTDENGQYTFQGLPAASYFVMVSDTANVLDDYAPSPVTFAPSLVDNRNRAQPYPVTLAAGGNNITADFGYVQDGIIGEQSVIGNQVWYDADGDGLYDPSVGDIGVAGVTVDLWLDSNGNNNLDPGDTKVMTRTTGASGDYNFTSLPAGTYFVEVTDDLGVLTGLIPTILGPNPGQDNNNQTRGTEYTVVLPADTINPTADFGFTLPAAIGDLVWYDTDRDGYQDVGEPGIANVTVDLYLDSNNNNLPDPAEKVATTTTGSDGGYIFTGLPPGDYIVDVVNATVPTGYQQIVLNQGEPDPTTPAITVAAGDFYEDADFAYYQPPTQPNGAIIGDTVWYDYDADGIQDANEPGIPGVTVRVTDSNNVTYTDITDENGVYQISVPTGPTLTYTVQPIAGVPGGFTPTTSTTQGVPPLQPGQQYLDADFGYDSNTLLGTIGNQVWHDTTPNGVFGAGEVGIPGVSVDLWRDPDAVPTWDGDEYIIATTTTNTSGQYTFQGLPAGSYFVEVSDTADVLADYLPSPVTFPPSATDNQNHAQPYPVALTAGGNNITADFGYIQNPNQPDNGVIGNQLWYETGTSVNGLFEPGNGDLGIEGVTMELLNFGNQVIATQVTGPSGDYAFTSLPAGTYRVRIGSSGTYPNNAAILGAYQPTVAGPNQGVDNNHQVPQPYTINLPAGGINTTADFGFTNIPPATIGDLVWYDTDRDGYQDVGEPGIGNVDVNLYRDNGTTPGVLDAGDTLVGTETTGADGGYIFTGLLPGVYFVDVVNATVPTGYTHLTLNQSLSDPTGPITVAAGDFYENADFGYYQPPTQPSGAMIGDSVWYDYDADGIRDPNEPGIPGVTVTVTDSNNVTYTDITDQNGNYLISVPTGPTLSYTVQPTAGLPPGYTATTPVPQTVPPLSPGAQYLDADFGYDSNTLLGTIGNQLWIDGNQNGIYEPGPTEPGIPGVSVDLWRNPDASATLNGDEYIIATTTTDTSGQYTFQGLPAGSYFVVVSDTANVLDDYLPSPTQFPPSLVDNRNRVQPYPVALVAGENNVTADFGYVPNPDWPNRGVIGNQLWYETGTSVNGLYEPGKGDVGIEGVTMELLNASNQVIATQVTGPSGDYAFTSLPAATYRVRIATSVTNTAILGAYQPTVAGPNQGVDNNHQVPQPYTIVLPAGGINTTADFGFTDLLPAAIGDLVWYDADRDGYQDVGEPGIGNVDLNLYRDNGTTPGVLDAGDTLVGTETTGADGGYIFTGLLPGTYLVDVVNSTVPTGYTHLTLNQSLSDPTGPITVTAGDFYENADFGYYQAPPAGQADHWRQCVV